MREEIIAILVTLTLVLATCSLVVFLSLRYLARSRELLSAERRAAIEKGLEGPVDLPAALPRRFRWNPLKLAILLIGAGGALTLIGIWENEKEPMMFGFFILAIGLSNLTYYRLSGKQEWERETAMYEELHRACLRRLAPPPRAADAPEGDRT